MSEVFDKPKWDFKLLRTDGFQVHAPDTYLKLEFYDKQHHKAGSIHVYPPAGLVTWLHDVAKVTHVGDAILYLDCVGKNWVLGVNVPKGEYDLWHYTPSTLPYWAQKVMR